MLIRTVTRIALFRYSQNLTTSPCKRESGERERRDKAKERVKEKRGEREEKGMARKKTERESERETDRQTETKRCVFAFVVVVFTLFFLCCCCRFGFVSFR